MESKLFIPETRSTIEKNIIALLNSNQLMNYNTVNSPRAVGDAVQGFLEKNIAKCLPRELLVKINTSFARRSMADLAFEDVTEKYYVVDIKTHNLNTAFNRVVQKLQFLNNFQIKPAKCRAFCETCETTNRVVEQVQYAESYFS
jgi:hypothetical protein